MSRSKWKNSFLKYKFIYKKKSELINKIIVSRNSKIVPKFYGLNCFIYNGQNYFKLLVTEDMLGHKFGEFAFTRKIFVHKKKKKKKKR